MCVQKHLIIFHDDAIDSERTVKRHANRFSPKPFCPSLASSKKRWQSPYFGTIAFHLFYDYQIITPDYPQLTLSWNES